MRRLILSVLAAVPLVTHAAQSPPSVDSGIEQRVDSIVGRMSLEEKIDLLAGSGLFSVRGVPRLGVPPMTAGDGPYGVRNFTRADVIAGGIALAASWDSGLARRAGVQMGREARARGVHFYLAPAVNIYRSPLNGRNFEYLGEDPYLAGQTAAAFIMGVQSQGVAATVKHYLGNNSEFARHTTDDIIDERTAREIYLPAFEAAVKLANVAAVMDSYNLVNGEHMTDNRHFNVDVLKDDWGFKGIVMSDWGATDGTLAAASGGLDLEMPAPAYFNRTALEPLLRDAKVSMATIDDKVRRILRVAVRLGWLDRPQRDPSIPQYDARGRALALQTALEGIVLLKNAHGVLPLDSARIRSLAVIGPNAYPAVPMGGGSVTVAPFHATSLLEGIGDELGTHVNVYYSRGIEDLGHIAAATPFATAARGGQPGVEVEDFDNLDLAGKPRSTRIEPHIDEGVPIDLTALAAGDRSLATISAVRQTSSRWTGYYLPAAAGTEDICVQVGGFGQVGYRLYVDDRLVADHWSRKTAMIEAFPLALDVRPHKIVLEQREEAGGLNGRVPFVRLGIAPEGSWVEPDAKQFAARADAVIVAVGFDAASEAEDWDRTFGLPPGEDELIRTVCALNRRCVVVVNSGGAIDTSSWLDHVAALLEAWYPGEEGGTALAKVLFGSADPSGHLPVTFERRWEDNPVYASYYPQTGTDRVRYREGVFVGYRGYEKRGIAPHFPFGYGLSYTRFAYGNLEVRPSTTPGSLYEVSFTVKNTGARAGAAVPQLYVGPAAAPVPRPPQELKAFARVSLRPGESRRIVLPLDTRSFAYYDVGAGCWRAVAGTYRVLIGESSEHVVLAGSVTLAHPILARR